jgi:shikimate kinase
MPLTIALVGLPGGGKSTVGKQLARQLHRTFVDSDIVIEQRLGCSIKSYFEIQGEEAFRDVEAQVIAQLTQARGTVLATGGGAVIREANRRCLKTQCDVIYLCSSPEQLAKRLRYDTQRPLLQVADPLARLRDLFAKRDPLYREVATHIVQTGAPSVSALVRSLVVQLGLELV